MSPMDIDITEVIAALDGTSAVARICNVKPPSVSEWRRNGRFPEAQCPTIEFASKGRFICEGLRSDVQWVRIKDKDWPHPKGRPLVDHSAKAVSADPAKEAA